MTAQVTQALSALALSRASDPKMTTVTQFLQDPDWLSVDGGAVVEANFGGAEYANEVPNGFQSIIKSQSLM